MIKFFIVLVVILAQAQVVYAEAGTSTSIGTWTTDWIALPSSVMSIYEKCPKHNVEMEEGGWFQVSNYWIWGWICPLCEIEVKELVIIESLDSPVLLPERDIPKQTLPLDWE